MMEGNMINRPSVRKLLTAVTVLGWLLSPACFAGAEELVIAASPSLKLPLEALAQAYEAAHPDVHVKLSFSSGLELRQTIAAMENSVTGRFFIGTGPVHLVAPGGDELITRLEQRYYVLPGTRRTYLQVPLVLVVPDALVDAPTSFETLGGSTLRVAVADPERTQTGKATQGLLQSLGLLESLKDRMDVASDARGVLDHVLSGQADAGIIFGSDAVKEQRRVRVTAVAPKKGYRPVAHSMAMERYCPNRALCQEFLTFIQTPAAKGVLKRLGYDIPEAGE
jgi:molybdate transport system substrate-binding protein